MVIIVILNIFTVIGIAYNDLAYTYLIIDILTNQVALGFSHVLILTMEHFVYSYGEGGHGQLGHNDNKSCHSPKLIESTKEIAMFRYDITLCHMISHDTLGGTIYRIA